MAVQDGAVFNKMHDAKTEFHYQLCKSEHKSYYGAQDLEILEECKTVANAGWLQKLAGVKQTKVAPTNSFDNLKMAHEINWETVGADRVATRLRQAFVMARSWLI